MWRRRWETKGAHVYVRDVHRHVDKAPESEQGQKFRVGVEASEQQHFGE